MMRFLMLSFFALLYHATLPGQVPPVEGDEFLKLIGLRESSAQVSELKSYVGSNGNPKGIRLVFMNSRLARIELFNENNPWGEDIKQFQGKLPMGLHFMSTIKDAKQALGNGFEVSGEVSSNYYVNKSFDLDGTDAYQMNLEFMAGRLMTVSIVLVEGAGGGAGEDGGIVASDAPVKGEDFLAMIKKNLYNKGLQATLGYLGEPTERSKKYIIHQTGGLEVIFNQKGQVEWVYLYGGGQTSQHEGIKMEKSPLPLPLGLKFGDNMDKIIKFIGSPSGNEGGVSYINEGYARVYLIMSGGGLSMVKVGVNPDFTIEKTPSKKPVRND